MTLQATSQPFVRPHPKPLDVAKYDPFLAACPVIDCGHPLVQDRAALLAHGLFSDEAIAKACFEWVRDEIQHSVDFERGPVTCKASDVLAHRTGFCFAKSHLLAALLRANGVPAGLTYQRLRRRSGGYLIHGLNVVHLPQIGWYRLDARGNKDGVQAEFTPPRERLPWDGKGDGEVNAREIWATPLTQVVDLLNGAATWQDVRAHLPDSFEA
ncbi:transglutaminase family protein [Magnetovibrio sp.]|uniref:transglutaminase-like domain-containing protein n=1 Tax=Magnetovibrio sp. TaxID=2024836 RepID=UPI002F923586